VAAEQTHTSEEKLNSQQSEGTPRTYHPVSEIELSPQGVREELAQAHSFASRVRTLSEIALQIDGARTEEAILNTLGNEIVWLIDSEVSFVAVLGPSRTDYIIHTLSSIADATELNGSRFLLNEGMPGWVIDHRSPVCAEVATPLAFHPEIEGVLQDLGMKHLLVVPLQTSDDTIGALALSTGASSSYREQDMWLAQLLALHVAVALKNINLFEDAKKRITQIELVNDIAEKLTSTLDLDELLASAAVTIRKAFNYFDVTIFMVNREEKELVLVAHSGYYGDFLPDGYHQKMSDGIIGWVATHGEKVVANDVTADQHYLAYEYHTTQSELAVPIRIEGVVVGILNVEDTKLHAFDETDGIVLETLCDQLGSAINKAKLFDQVRKSNATLTELDRMKSDFLGIVSHDFRAPLASIILAAKTMLKRGLDIEEKRLTDYLTIIVDQADKLRQLAEDTLSITKLESGRLSYSFKVVNVERLIKDAAALVHLSRRHTIEVTVDENVSYIKGDQSKLRQLVHNLLNNAVKYSPKGGLVKVTAEPWQLDEILVSVHDEGIGIPQDQAGLLFQKFSRLDTPEVKEIKGSGLGLWICSEIVKAHGGRIWVESETGMGSTFKFTLKRALHDDER